VSELIGRVISGVASLPPWVLVAAVLATMIVETSALVGLLVPGEIVVVVVAAALDAGWAPLVALAALIGTLVGQSGGFWLGRRFGPALRTSWLGRTVGARRWDLAESVMRGSGARSLIGTRFVAVLHAVMPVVIGSLRLPYRRFLRLALAGGVLWAIAQTGLGVAIGQVGRALDQRWAPFAFGVPGLALAGFLVVRAVRRHRKTEPTTPAPAGTGTADADVKEETRTAAEIFPRDADMPE